MGRDNLHSQGVNIEGKKVPLVHHTAAAQLTSKVYAIHNVTLPSHLGHAIHVVVRNIRGRQEQAVQRSGTR